MYLHLFFNLLAINTTDINRLINAPTPTNVNNPIIQDKNNAITVKIKLISGLIVIPINVIIPTNNKVNINPSVPRSGN